MTADAWEPIDFLAEFRERETCPREVRATQEKSAIRNRQTVGSSSASHRRRTGLLSRLAPGRDRALRRVALPRISTRRSARLHRRGSRQTGDLVVPDDQYIAAEIIKTSKPPSLSSPKSLTI